MFARRVFLCFAAVVLLVSSVFAQDLDDVTIAGRVVDSNSLAIVGATVTATAVETGEVRTIQTDDEGRYKFIKLRPGIYKVKTAATGFGIQETPEIPTISAQNVQQDFKLAPADVRAETTVTVTGDGPPVDVTRTIVGGTITEREIEEIPNNTRNPLDLVLTLGGTSEEQLSVSGLAEDRNQNSSGPPLEQGNYSLSGGVAYSNNLTIDGLDNNDDRGSRDRFQPSLESIAEVQVISNQFSAEYGRASGGRINLRTRAGGKRFRGRAFMFFRDDNLNANSWYNNQRKNMPIPPLMPPDTNPLFNRQPLTEYNPGFTFSGPVILPYYNGRKKTFFSVAYEYTDVQDTTFIDTWVPVGSNPRFPLPRPSSTACPANVLACNDNSSSPATPILPFQATVPTPNRNNVFTARVDHNFTSNNSFTFGFQLGRKKNQRTTGASTTRLDDALQVRNSDTNAYNFTDNQVFSSKVVNQVRGQYSIFQPSFQTSDPLGSVVLISYTNPSPGGGAQTLIAGNSTSAITGDATGFPQNRTETRYQIQDSLTYLVGGHTLKFGFDAMKIRSKALGLGDATGTFNFTGVLNFQNNVISRYRQNFGTRSDVKNTYTGVFFNDEMKLRSNITFSYGLRYERETAVSDNNNFGPRLGIAWDPFKKGKGVIRFGAGRFFNRVLLRTVADSIQNTGGNLVSFDTNLIPNLVANDNRRRDTLAAIAANFPGSFASPDAIRSMLTTVCANISPAPPATSPCTTSMGFLSSVTSTGNPLRTVEANLKIPESYQFNIGFERELFKGWVFEANYTWNKTVHLWRDTNSNVPNLARANALLGTNYSDWTDYLRNQTYSITNQGGTIRTYSFVLGATNDPSGVGPCSFTTTNTCVVNLNTTSTSTTAPAAASTGNNNNATGGPIGIARAAIAQFRPNPNLSETSVIGSKGNAFYQGLILELRSRYRKLGNGFGASFRMAYTFSKTMDDGLNNTSNAEINGNFSREWARSLQDRRQRLAFSGSFDTPWWFGKLKFSPLVRFGTSSPFNLGAGGSDRNLDDSSTDRINFSGNLSDIRWREPGSPNPSQAYISQFTLAPIGAKSGNLPRNAGHGPSFYTFDLSVTRQFKLAEHKTLRPVIQFDNILNATVFSYGSAFINFNGLTVTNSTSQANFLVPTRTYRQRQIRLGVRFDF